MMSPRSKYALENYYPSYGSLPCKHRMQIIENLFNGRDKGLYKTMATQ